LPPVIDPRAHVQSVSLRVRSAAGVARLYEDAIGLRRLPDGAARGDVVLGDRDGRPLVVLYESRGAPPAPRRGAGLFHTAIRFGSRSALAGALRSVLQAGFRLTGASDHGVSEALYLDDPEENGVELYWDRAREDWPVRPDGGVEMYTRRLDVRGLLEVADDAPVDSGVDVGHAHLKVTDIDRAVAFWRDALGLDLKLTYGREAAFLAAGDYHHHIGLNVWQSGGGPALPEDALGLERVTLALPDEEALRAAIERARPAAGGSMHVEGVRAVLRDPDGILVELRVV
jgi:catechol 2,3-dioxygenase